MANVNAPSGFRLAKHITGGVANRLSRYHIAGGYSSDIFVGDVVEPVTTSKNIQRPAAATDRLQGIFNGCYYLDPNQSAPQYNRRWPASTVIVTGSTVDAWVHDDPKDIFEAQVSGAFALGNIGKLANILLGTGNAFTKQSADSIDSTTFGTGANIKIIDIVNRPDNAVGSFARVLCAIALHYYGGAMTNI